MAFAFHRERFSRSRLPVGKDGAVVAGQHFLHQRGRHHFVDVDLLRRHPEDSIEAERLGQRALLHHLDFPVVRFGRFDHDRRAGIFLLRIDGPIAEFQVLINKIDIFSNILLVIVPDANKDLDILVLISHFDKSPLNFFVLVI